MARLFKSKGHPEDKVALEVVDICEHVISDMGAEIHDDLMQKLSVFRLFLDRLERSKSDPAEVESLIVSMKANFQEVVQSVRRISRRLLPAKTEGDSFEKGIRMLCQNMERPGGGTIHFENSGTECPVNSQADIHLYRITQELIHNAHKHSAAWHVWVRLAWTEKHLTIQVEDDGTGFSKINDSIEALRKKHNTLKMRSDILDATVQYSQGKRGLLATVKYPIET